MQNRFLTVEEVASHLRVSEYSVRRYIKSGQFKAVALGKQYRVPVEELDIFCPALAIGW